MSCHYVINILFTSNVQCRAGPSSVYLFSDERGQTLGNSRKCEANSDPPPAQSRGRGPGGGGHVRPHPLLLLPGQLRGVHRQGAGGEGEAPAGHSGAGQWAHPIPRPREGGEWLTGIGLRPPDPRVGRPRCAADAQRAAPRPLLGRLLRLRQPCPAPCPPPDSRPGFPEHENSRGLLPPSFVKKYPTLSHCLTEDGWYPLVHTSATFAVLAVEPYFC